MKKITTSILSCSLILLAILSCRDDSIYSVPKTEPGPNVRIIPDATTQSINFFSDLSKATVKFDIFSSNKNLSVVNLKVLRTSAGVNSDTVTIKSFSQADFDAAGGAIKGVVITVPEIAAALHISGGIAGLKGADIFTFLNYTTLSNGVVYPTKITATDTNLSPTIVGASATGSFTSNFLVALVCPSAIVEGSYTATQDDHDIWFGGPNPLPTTNQVTITKVAGTANQYLISDVTAAGYFTCCGFNLNQPAIIQDVCLSILVVSKGSGAQITMGQGVTAGSWDPATKTLIVHYDDVTNHSKQLGFDLVTKFVKN